MRPAEFNKFLARDGRCYHCGTTGDTLIPQHRINRGSGGSKTRDVPSNIIVMCSEANGRMESEAAFARMARSYGWKLSSWQDPLECQVFDVVSGQWFLLDDDYNRVTLWIV